MNNSIPNFFPNYMPNIPNMNMNNQDIKNIENRIYNLEKDINNLKNRISKLENTKNDNYNNYQQSYQPNSYNMM